MEKPIVMGSTQANTEIAEGFCPAQCARQYKDPPVLQWEYVVRRLTPLECERLQGFPDDWTKLDEKTPDTPRYKALGNSMAVPVMRWIGERIQAVDDIAGGGAREAC